MCDGLAARQRRTPRARGFTLIELMVTLAVLAILSMIAVPSFRHIIISTHLSGLSNDLAGDLQYARTEAVSRQVDVAVAASAGSWQNGWTVEIPSASTAPTATATVLREHAAVPPQYVVTAGPATSVTYLPQGTLFQPVDAVAGTCFTIYAPASAHNPPYFLQVSPVGMLQQSATAAVPLGSVCTAPPP